MQEKLLKKRKKLFEKLAKQEFIVRGSITGAKTYCGNPKCKCKTENKMHESKRLYWKDRNKKSKGIYLTKDKEKLAQKGLAHLKKFYDILEDIIEVNIEIIKSS